MKKLIAAAAALTPILAIAFYDSFDGNKLGSNWKFHEDSGSTMDYQVSNSLLTVTHVYGFPSGISDVILYTAVDQHKDFEATIRFGWDSGQRQYFVVGVGGTANAFNAFDLATFTLDELSGGPKFHVNLSGSNGVDLDGILPGMHEFRVKRSGTNAFAYFDGLQILSTTSSSQSAVAAAGLYFGGPNDNVGFAPLYVDLVEVVPEPLGFLSPIVAFILRPALMRSRLARI